MPDSPPLRLEVSHLCRSFGGRQVVDDVSLSVAAGQVTCLLGPSGCGKSTTLRMIAGVERAASGEVRLDGQTVAGPGVHVPPEVRSVGLI
jgi:iron(III) transport system ATP-binding protein